MAEEKRAEGAQEADAGGGKGGKMKLVIILVLVLVLAGSGAGAYFFKEKIPFKRPVLLIIGSEDQGVGSLLKKSVDTLVKIPMKGELDSLNASAAAAIALFEIARRRN